jgi:hypothetical protein
MAGPGPATYDLARCNTASRGWCAFAHHDTQEPMPRPKRFVYSRAGPKGLRRNKRFEWIALPPRVMAGLGPATHDLAQYNTASRGWCAVAHHATKGPMPRPKRFVYSRADPKRFKQTRAPGQSHARTWSRHLRLWPVHHCNSFVAGRSLSSGGQSPTRGPAMIRGLACNPPEALISARSLSRFCQAGPRTVNVPAPPVSASTPGLAGRTIPPPTPR